MPIPFTGGCACDAIRYECSAEPVLTASCHCRDCQRASGSAFNTALVVPTSAFRLIQGKPKDYAKQSDSGNTLRRAFCGACGSPLFTRNVARPALVGIKAASVDDPSWVRPGVNIWTSSAQPWDCINPEIDTFETGPTAEYLQELFAPVYR